MAISTYRFQFSVMIIVIKYLLSCKMCAECRESESTNININQFMNYYIQYFQIEMFKIRREQLWVARILVTNARHSSSNKHINSEVFKQERLKKLVNIEMYPYRFDYNSDISRFRDNYDHLQQSETAQEEIRLTGMITNFRDYGKKLKFLDIEKNGETLQLKISKDYFHDELEFSDLTEILSKGDKVGGQRHMSKMLV